MSPLDASAIIARGECLRVLSMGAGVQSTTIALMAARGDIGPMPHCGFFADTGWEPAAVYRHLAWLETQLPFPIYHVRRPGPDLGAHALAVAAGTLPRQGSALPPWYVADPDTALPKQCSKEFKTRVVIAGVRALLGLEPRQRGPDRIAVDCWMGISLEEIERVKTAEPPWMRNVYPLIDQRMRRHDCYRWLEDRQYPRPPKSACIFCPYTDLGRWRDMQAEGGADWARLVAFDQSIRAGYPGMTGAAYVSRQRVPIDQVDMARPDADQYRFGFANECEGHCGT